MLTHLNFYLFCQHSRTHAFEPSVPGQRLLPPSSCLHFLSSQLPRQRDGLNVAGKDPTTKIPLAFPPVPSVYLSQQILTRLSDTIQKQLQSCSCSKWAHLTNSSCSHKPARQEFVESQCELVQPRGGELTCKLQPPEATSKVLWSPLDS